MTGVFHQHEYPAHRTLQAAIVVERRNVHRQDVHQYRHARRLGDDARVVGLHASPEGAAWPYGVGGGVGARAHATTCVIGMKPHAWYKRV